MLCVLTMSDKNLVIGPSGLLWNYNEFTLYNKQYIFTYNLHFNHLHTYDINLEYNMNALS
jgi:hypothetical protein